MVDVIDKVRINYGVPVIKIKLYGESGVFNRLTDWSKNIKLNLY